MKKLNIFILLVVFAAIFIFQQHAYAQEVLSGSLISSGASTSSYDSYISTITVGQPCIGVSSSASYTLISDVEKEKENKLPTDYKLFQNYPNPFNLSTTISFKIPKYSFVSLKIFIITGEEVAVLVNGNMLAGNHKIQWNANNLSSGIYFYRLQTAEFVETKKLLLIK
jgi:hypothetical protein